MYRSKDIINTKQRFTVFEWLIQTAMIIQSK